MCDGEKKEGGELQNMQLSKEISSIICKFARFYVSRVTFFLGIPSLLVPPVS